jgi:NADH-quinone oxidoreductase subunit N
VSVYYYLRVTVAMYMEGSASEAEKEMASLVFTPAVLVAIFIAAYGVLSLGLFPSSYLDIVKQSFLAMR